MNPSWLGVLCYNQLKNDLCVRVHVNAVAIKVNFTVYTVIVTSDLIPV